MAMDSDHLGKTDLQFAVQRRSLQSSQKWASVSAKSTIAWTRSTPPDSSAGSSLPPECTPSPASTNKWTEPNQLHAGGLGPSGVDAAVAKLKRVADHSLMDPKLTGNLKPYCDPRAGGKAQPTVSW